MPRSNYHFNIRHRYGPSDDPEALYERAYAHLSTLPPPWGWKGVAKKPMPSMSKDCGVSYTREMGAPYTSIAIGFMNRRRVIPPTDAGFNDDTLIGDFNMNHKSIDYAYLMREVFPVYVEAMNAYAAWLSDDKVQRHFMDAERDLGNGRDRVGVIFPANFWDRELCHRAFDLTPEQTVNRLQGHVAEARVLRDGALVIYSYERVPDGELHRIDEELRPLLQKGLRLASSHGSAP